MFNLDDICAADRAYQRDGGAGSGNRGHAGRPGQRGGSGSGGGKANRLSTPEGGFTSMSQAYKENKQRDKAKAAESKANRELKRQIFKEATRKVNEQETERRNRAKAKEEEAKESVPAKKESATKVASKPWGWKEEAVAQSIGDPHDYSEGKFGKIINAAPDGTHLGVLTSRGSKNHYVKKDGEWHEGVGKTNGFGFTKYSAGDKKVSPEKITKDAPRSSLGYIQATLGIPKNSDVSGIVKEFDRNALYGTQK